MKHHNRSLIFIGIILVAVVIYVVSAGHSTVSAADNTPTPTPATSTVTVSWSVWGSPEELASHKHVADVFMKEHSGIKIEVRHTPWEKYHDNLRNLIATGDPNLIPDIMWLGMDFDRYHAAGMLENLTPWVNKTNYNLSDYFPHLIERASYPEGLFGLQRDQDLRLLYYNKNIFDSAGVAYPTNEWTWDDWAAAAKKLSIIQNGAVTRFGIAMEVDKFDMLLYQNNGSLIDDVFNPGKCTLDNLASLDAVRFLAGLLNNHLAMRPDELAAAGGDTQAFISGKAAMIIQNGSRAPTFNDAKLNYDVAPVPYPKNGHRVNNNDGARFVMSSRSLHKAQAWTFLSWLQSKEGGQSIYTADGQMFPALRSVANSDVFMNTGTKPDNRKAFSIEAESGIYLVLGEFPDWDEMNNSIVTPSLTKIWNGEGKPEDIVPNLCDQVNIFLSQNGYPRPK